MSRKSSQPRREVLGLIQQKRQSCGVCGVKKLMSRAHVPPQCAGNQMLVKRYSLIGANHEVGRGRQLDGGIHLYGLCADCNTKAGRFDGAYGDLAAALRSLWVKSWQVELPPTIKMPRVTFDPGGVARSILLGMCATGPHIRHKWPDLPVEIASGARMELPPELRLHLAMARGLTARVAGAIIGFHLYGPHMRRGTSGRPLAINAAASVYFPPLAWELILPGESILPHGGWPDVSSWTTIKPGEIHLLADLVPALPAVCHPWHHPTRSEHWVELFSSELTAIVECANVEGGPPDPRVPLTLDKRAQLSVEEVKDRARRQGVIVPD